MKETGRDRMIMYTGTIYAIDDEPACGIKIVYVES